MKSVGRKYLALVLSVLMIVGLISSASFADPEEPAANEHSHVWQAAVSAIANGQQATITCAGEGECNVQGPLTVSLTAEGGVETAEGYQAVYDDSGLGAAQDLISSKAISYTKDGQAFSGVPNAPGTYTATTKLRNKATNTNIKGGTLTTTFEITSAQVHDWQATVSDIENGQQATITCEGYTRSAYNYADCHRRPADRRGL